MTERIRQRQTARVNRMNIEDGHCETEDCFEAEKHIEELLEAVPSAPSEARAGAIGTDPERPAGEPRSELLHPPETGGPSVAADAASSDTALNGAVTAGLPVRNHLRADRFGACWCGERHDEANWLRLNAPLFHSADDASTSREFEAFANPETAMNRAIYGDEVVDAAGTEEAPTSAQAVPNEILAGQDGRAADDASTEPALAEERRCNSCSLSHKECQLLRKTRAGFAQCCSGCDHPFNLLKGPVDFEGMAELRFLTARFKEAFDLLYQVQYLSQMEPVEYKGWERRVGEFCGKYEYIARSSLAASAGSGSAGDGGSVT